MRWWQVITPKQFQYAMSGRRKKELRRLLGAEGESWRDVLKRLDTDRDGKISYAEFKAAAKVP